MQATCQNERMGAQRGEPLLLWAPPRVRNQIEMGEKPSSNNFNLHSGPKGGITKVVPLTLAYFKLSQFP